MMKNKLGLDSPQVRQIEAINLKYAVSNEPILKGGQRKLAKFKQLKSSQQDKDAELKRFSALNSTSNTRNYRMG